MQPSYQTLTFDEADAFLNEVAQGIPPEIFSALNGGIVLLPNTVPSPHSIGADLYTLGTYHYEPQGLGRYISLNYGSFVKTHGNKPVSAQKKALQDVLYHELTHHLESLAGVRNLVVKDEVFIENYQTRHKKPKK